MNTLFTLQTRAVRAAQEERWQDAVSLNQEIIALDAKNLGALNRLGFSYLQGNNTKDAEKTYKQVLELDNGNVVAKKYLDIIKKKQPLKLPKALKHSDFVDEPGKTKSTQLMRLAAPNVMAELSVGGDCQLKSSPSRISVQCEGVYIGSLPDDLAMRMRPLIEAGNRYQVKIQSLKNHTITIFMREIERATSMAHISSFPSESSIIMALDSAELARGEEEPVYMGETGEGVDDSMALRSGDIDEALSSDHYHPDDDEREETPADDDDDK